MNEKITEDEKFFVNIHKKTKQFKYPPYTEYIPPVFKKINTKKIKLPKNFEKSDLSVEDAIINRISRRDFFGCMSLKEVAKLLYFATGFKELIDFEEEGIVQRGNAPSAGSRHPIELYVILQRVNDIEDGVYHYDIENHMLETIAERKLAKWQNLNLLNKQKQLVNSNIILFMTAIHRRTSWKYGPRAYRFIHLDAGHIGQNIYLISETMGLGACAVGGWNDKVAEKLLKIDGVRELIVYVMVIGKKTR